MANIKRKCVLIVVMLLVLVLGACNSNTAKSDPYSEVVEIDGQSLTITLDENNLSAGTITSENGTYTFEFPETALFLQLTTPMDMYFPKQKLTEDLPRRQSIIRLKEKAKAILTCSPSIIVSRE